MRSPFRVTEDGPFRADVVDVCQVGDRRYPGHYVWSDYKKVISDQPGPRSYIPTRKGRQLRWKPVTVYRYSATPNHGSSSFVCSSSNYCTYYPAADFQAFMFGGYPGSLSGWLWDYMCDRIPQDTNGYNRWLSVRPSLSTRLDLGAFLAELREVKSIFDILPSKHCSIASWKGLLEYARFFNGLDLKYNFGWKPFVSDVKKTIRTMRAFDIRFEKFMREQNNAINRRTQTVSDPVTLNVTGTLPYASGWSYQVTGTIRPTFRSQFQMEYHVPYKGDEARWRGLLDSLGLRPNLSTFWEVIPKSFIVDWFVDCGGALRALDSDWLQPYIHVLQAEQSVRAVIDAEVKIYGFCGASKAKVISLGGDLYTRKIGMPAFKLDTPSLDADKIRLLASLMAQATITPALRSLQTN